MATYTCPGCNAPIQAGERTCATCGLGLDPASLAVFQSHGGGYQPPRGSYSPAASTVIITQRNNGCLVAFAVIGIIVVVALVLLCGTSFGTGFYQGLMGTPARR